MSIPFADPDTDPVFPPLFTPVTVGGDALRHAVTSARAGAGAGSLSWSRDADRFSVAVVFEPEMNLRAARFAHYVTMVGMADALGVLGPPYKPITFAWPDRLVLDGAVVGQVRLVAPEQPDDEVPEWLVAGVAIRLRFPGTLDDPGRTPDRTALYEEGFGDVTAPALAEAFARHLLNWISRWLEEGAESVASEWLSHLPLDIKNGDVRHGLDPKNGDLLLLDPGSTKPRRRDLAAGLALAEAEL